MYRQVAMCVFQNVRDMKYCVNKLFVFQPQEEYNGMWRDVDVAWLLVSRRLGEVMWYCVESVHWHCDGESNGKGECIVVNSNRNLS